jgi:hypothetical protein
MAALEILAIILGVLVYAVFLYNIWNKKRTAMAASLSASLSPRSLSVGQTLALSLPMVILQSHVFHIFFGEGIAAELCDPVPRAFFQCVTRENLGEFLVDTYEITVFVSIIAMAGVTIAFAKKVTNIVAMVLTIAVTLPLPFLPYNELKDYVIVYDFTGALLALVSVVVLLRPDNTYEPVTQ